MIQIPISEFKFSFSRSSGAGGQNVNKLNTKVTLFWEIDSSPSLLPSVKKRFKEKYERYLVDEVVVIHSQLTRSQNHNISDCVAKLHVLLQKVEVEPKIRKATKPTKSAVKKRLETKKQHSDKKKLRRERF